MRHRLTCAAVLPLCVLSSCHDTAGLETKGVVARPLFSITIGAEEQITTDPNRQDEPGIAGDYIMWVDDRHGRYDIYAFDLVSQTEMQVTASNPNAQVGWMPPAISGDRIVWEDYRNGASDIYMFDLSEAHERQITSDKSSQICTAISGDRIVWDDRRNGTGNSDIYMFDLAADTETQITVDPNNQHNPAVSDDRVVWLDSRYTSRRIFMYDFTDGTESEIPTDLSFDPGKPLCPALAISGTVIAWADYRSGNYDIYMFDLATNTETQITDHPSNQRRPAVFGGRIVWDDDRDGGWNIYMFDLATQTEAQVTSNGVAYNPAIFSDRIVWADWRSGSEDIYMVAFSTTLEPSIEVMVELVDQLVAEGAIDNTGVAHAFLAHLEQAAAAIDRGNSTAAENKLNAFINFVNAQSGKHVQPDAAQELIELANRVIEQGLSP
ncbi:MAG: hypothetical protein JSW71_05385 [Gemmatimonadota bacterium]|nr:MAG: hypothetical protein JSW71_05385 [Gemmatimonadota bacterium]